MGIGGRPGNRRRACEPGNGNRRKAWEQEEGLGMGIGGRPGNRRNRRRAWE